MCPSAEEFPSTVAEKVKTVAHTQLQVLYVAPTTHQMGGWVNLSFYERNLEPVWIVDPSKWSGEIKKWYGYMWFTMM